MTEPHGTSDSKLGWTLVLLVSALLAWSAWQPKDRLTWWMEVAPVLIAAPMLWATRRRFPLTPLLYALIALHCSVLILGGAYSYARVPLGFWLQDLMHWAQSLRQDRPLHAGLRAGDGGARDPAARPPRQGRRMLLPGDLHRAGDQRQLRIDRMVAAALHRRQGATNSSAPRATSGIRNRTCSWALIGALAALAAARARARPPAGTALSALRLQSQAMSNVSMNAGLLVAMVCAPCALHAQQPQQTPSALRVDGVPPIAAATLERTAPYENTRSAELLDFAAKGASILIATRFGDVAQVHEVGGPGRD